MPLHSISSSSLSSQERAVVQKCRQALEDHKESIEELHLRLGQQEEEFLLPKSLMVSLIDVLKHFEKGQEIHITSKNNELTTAQVAEILNVSRPYLIENILEKGMLPFRKVGKHRRILMEDVLDYKNKIQAQRTAFLEEMIEHDQSCGLGPEWE